MPEWRGRLRESAVWIALAGVTCAVLLLPVLWPYAELARTQGLVRGLGETQACAATWTDYFFTGSRLHFDAWSYRFKDSSDANFPGLVVAALAVVGLVSGWRRGPHARMWLAVVAGSVLLSALPQMPGFAWLHAHVPALGAIRCYSRAGQMALVGMGVLAGTGRRGSWGACAGAFRARALHAGARRPTPPRGTGARAARARGLALAIVLVAAVNLEALRAPLWYRDYPGVPAIYGTLRDQPGAVIELPFYGRGGFFGNAGYMINATRHRRPLVNGYSGFAPPGFEATAQMMRAFPREDALQLLETLGVTHVVVHRATAPMQRRRALIDASPRLQLAAEQDGIAVYRIAGTKGSDPFVPNP